MIIIAIFIYLGSSILSTESDVSIHVDKACTAIERLSTIWRSDQKLEFFYAVVVSVLLYGSTTWTLIK